MKTLLTLVVGGIVGFIFATLIGETDKKIVQMDRVVLRRDELVHVAQAIDALKDRKSERGFIRYVADSNTLSFECPNDEYCNLDVASRAVAKAPDVEVIHTKVVTTTSATVRKKPSGSVYDRIGLRSGDIITSVNGTKMSSPTEAVAELARASNSPDGLKEISILRDGKQMDLSLAGD